MQIDQYVARWRMLSMCWTQ